MRWIEQYAAELEAIGSAPPPAPRWNQDWFPRLDAAAAYAMVRNTRPRRIVEVGSGHSTRFMARAVADGGLGFVISMNLYDVYYAGDTQIIPEMASLHPDVAILPIDGRGTMDVDGAVQAVRQMRPRWVIPSNWGAGSEGASRLDAMAFKREAEQHSEVVILPQVH